MIYGPNHSDLVVSIRSISVMFPKIILKSPKLVLRNAASLDTQKILRHTYFEIVAFVRVPLSLDVAFGES